MLLCIDYNFNCNHDPLPWRVRVMQYAGLDTQQTAQHGRSVMEAVADSREHKSVHGIPGGNNRPQQNTRPLQGAQCMSAAGIWLTAEVTSFIFARVPVIGSQSMCGRCVLCGSFSFTVHCLSLCLAYSPSPCQVIARVHTHPLALLFILSAAWPKAPHALWLCCFLLLLFLWSHPTRKHTDFADEWFHPGKLW